MSWLRTLWRVFSNRAKLVGTDLDGNQYFEKAASSTEAMPHIGSRPRRSVKMNSSGKALDSYTPDSIPPEWDRWLRGLEKDPPSIEAMATRIQQSKIMERKVFDVEQKDKQLREKEIAEGLVAAGPQRTKATGHASARSYGLEEGSGGSEEPTSTGKDFKPASWKPADSDSSKTK